MIFLQKKGRLTRIIMDDVYDVTYDRGAYVRAHFNVLFVVPKNLNAAEELDFSSPV